MAAKVKLNLRGLAEAASSPAMARAVTEAANRVASNARGQSRMVEGEPGDVAMPIEVRSGRTHSMRVNRAKAWVLVAHPAGQADQAKNGTLTKAAAQAGLKVRSR